jgi:hypothetical protein
VWIGTSLKRVIFVTTSGGKQVLRCVGRLIHPSARRGVPTKFALPEFVILEDEGVVDPGHPYPVPQTATRTKASTTRASNWPSASPINSPIASVGGRVTA